MRYPVLRLEYREVHWVWLRWLRLKAHEEIELLKMAMEARPAWCKFYKGGLHYGHVLYMLLVGLFAHGPYAAVAMTVGILLLFAPIFGSGEE